MVRFKKCAPKVTFSTDFIWKIWMITDVENWLGKSAIFGRLTSVINRVNTVLWPEQSGLQSEMFLSNSVEMMKNLL